MAYSSSPCADLGETEEHWVYRLLCDESNRRGVCSLDLNDVASRLHTGGRKVSNAIGTLVDMGLVEAIEASVWRVAEKCPHLQFLASGSGGGEDFSPDFCKKSVGEATMSPVGTSSPGVSAIARTLASTHMGVGVRGRGGKNPTAPLTTVYLAKYYFPAQVRRTLPGKLGIHNTSALCAQIRNWKNQGYTLETVKSMIDMFCLHPEWTKSGAAAWRVFVGKGDQLLGLTQRHQRDLQVEQSRSSGRVRGDSPERIQRKLGLLQAAGQ